MITEGSWTTPAEPAWIPETMSARDDGKLAHFFLSIWSRKFVIQVEMTGYLAFLQFPKKCISLEHRCYLYKK